MRPPSPNGARPEMAGPSDDLIQRLAGRIVLVIGDLMVDHVIFDAISGPAFSARGSAIGVLYARDDMPEVGDPASIDVTDRFADDYEHRATRGNRTQYRLHFPHDLAGDPAYTAYHSDGAWDILQLLRDGTQLSVTYLIE